MTLPRYPQPKRARRLSFLLGICVISLGVFLGYRFFTSSGPEALSESLNSSAHASTGAAVTPGITDAALLAEYPNGPLPDGLVFDRLLLEKSQRRLTAFSKDTPVRIYTVALGTSPDGAKHVQGDRKTPEGKYTIDGKNPNSAYHKNLGISYPNAADREFARKEGKSPGGDIKIHGLAPAFAEIGAAHRTTDWTFGCIAVTNPEIDELYARTPVGIPIEILP